MYKKILVCLDGSKRAEQILPYVTEQALRFNSKVVLFQAVPPPVVASPGVPGVAGSQVETKEMLEKAQRVEATAEIYLGKVAQRLQRRKLKVGSVVWVGPVGESIITYADSNKVNLIAIATHGHGGLKRAVFGSVADFILRNSTLPMLVIKPQ